jgi:bifunctional DNase/RNase
MASRISRRELVKMASLGMLGANVFSGCSVLKLGPAQKMTEKAENDQKVDSSLRKVEIAKIIPAMDGNIVALKDNLNRILPIIVGQFEADAIALGLRGKSRIRPMTHDLMQNIMESADIKVLSAVVTEEKNNVFFAKLHLIASGHKLEIDCRPSDAIALSVRTRTPIYVTEKVMSEKSRDQTPSTLG